MDEKEEKKESDSEKKGHSKSKLPLMLGGGAFILVLLLGGFFAIQAFTAPSEVADADSESSETSDEEIFASTGIYYREFGSFITVLEPSEEYNFIYLKFMPELELSNKDVLHEIATKLPIIESVINTIMTDLNWNVIKSEKGRARQSDKLKNKLNERLESGEIVQIYFTNLVAQ